MTTIAPLPPAPAGPPPAMTRGGRTALRVTLIVVATVLVVGTVAALGVAAFGASTVRVLTDGQNLPAAMRTLVVDAGDVPVAIRITADPDTRAPRASLRLVNTSSSGEHRLVVRDDRGETRVTIDGRPSRMLPWARGGELTIALPPDQARRLTVRTQQRTGVVLAEADIDQLFARTTDGAIVLSGAARRIEARTVDGDVVSRDPISVAQRFSATTSDGDIAVDFRAAAPRTVEATSRDGDVVLGLPQPGPYLVNAQSDESTEVNVPETGSATAAAGEITARSANGDVVVEDVNLSEHSRRGHR